MKELFAILAALLVIAGHAPYVRSMLRRTIEPHPYTWFVGAVISSIVFAGQYFGGAGIGILPTAVSALFSLSIFLLSFRYGFRGITKFDTALLALAILAIGPWLLTDDPTLSVVFAVGIDLIAFVPSLRKTWLRPQSEPRLVYAVNLVRHSFALMALEAYTLVTALHSIAMLAASGTMLLLIKRRSLRI